MRFVSSSSLRHLCLLVLLFGSLLGCRGNSRATTAITHRNTNNKRDSLGIDQELALPLPSIPMMIQKPEARARYLVEHFWQDLDFADSSFLINPRPLEASFANFVGIAISLPIKDIRSAIIAPLEKACAPLLEFFLKMYEKYLYDPNSPMRAEEYYIPILEWGSGSPRVSYATQIRLKDRLKLALRNRVGNPATDFSFLLADGSSSRLYRHQAERLLLVFYVPGCDSCNELIRRLRAMPQVEMLCNSGQLKILFIDAEADKDAWINEQIHLPSFFINGYNEDQSIITKQLYDLKASPTIYLLDAQKRVILKDTSIDRVIQQF